MLHSILILPYFIDYKPRLINSFVQSLKNELVLIHDMRLIFEKSALSENFHGAAYTCVRLIIDKIR